MSNTKQINDKKTLLIGRWSPFHAGHEYMVRSFLNNGKQVCILIRDTPLTKQDPISAQKREELIHTALQDKRGMFTTMIIPDIDTVAVGRDVGYSIVAVPDDIKTISGTKIREEKSISYEPYVFWFYGLTSSGKSTFAKAFYDFLIELGIYKVKLLDSDNERLNKDFSYKGRIKNINYLRKRAMDYQKDGYHVIVAAVTPYEIMRKTTVKMIKNCVHILTDCPLATCMERDTKGIYKKYSEGSIKTVSGLDDPFELRNPNNPYIHLTYDTETRVLEDNLASFLKILSIYFTIL